MVGDDWERDIAPAASLGLETYWGVDPASERPDRELFDGGIGPLGELRSWLEKSLMLNPLPQTDIKQQLAATVPALAAMTAGMDEAAWLYRPETDQWSVTEILCHLRDVDREVHLPRLQSVIDSEEPFMPGVVADDWRASAITRRRMGARLWPAWQPAAPRC